MSNLFKQFIKESKHTTLTKEEKSQGREQLLNFISVNPVRTDLVVRHRGVWSNMFNFLNTKPMPILLTIILALSAVGGVTLASQNALPGNVLYPVKLETENVRSVLSFSDKAKANLDSEFAQNRLEEAEALSDNSNLDDNTRTQLETNFEEHANRVEEHVKALASTDAKAAADINSNLSVSLKAHDRILSSLAEKKDSKIAPEINQLLVKIRSRADNADKNRAQEEIDVRINSDTHTETNIEQDNNASESDNIQTDEGIKVRLGL